MNGRSIKCIKSQKREKSSSRKTAIEEKGEKGGQSVNIEQEGKEKSGSSQFMIAFSSCRAIIARVDALGETVEMLLWVPIPSNNI